MRSIKHFLLLALLGCTLLLFAGEKTAVELCVKNAMKAGAALDFSTLKHLYSNDYVKIAQDKKIFDRRQLENSATYFERIKDPGLKFSELVKLNFMLKGQKLTEAQLANYRRLDSSERGKAMVKQAQVQVEAAQNNLRQVVKEVVEKCYYSPVVVKNDMAVCFYKLNYTAKIKGVLVLRKEENRWKVFRELLTLDTEGAPSVAVEAEVRNFINASHEAANDLSNIKDFAKYYSTENLSVFADGKSMDYHQAAKQAEFYDMLQKGTPPMAQAGPLFIESSGRKVTPEMQAHFAACDQSGKGKEWIMRYKGIIEKYRASMKNSRKYAIKEIFLFEDCALVIDQFFLPNNGDTDRISLLKKHQGKYLFYRSVSRKTAPRAK